jgi:hypothetical protein
MSKEELQAQLAEIRKAELQEFIEKQRALMEEYKVRLDCEFAYINGQLKTNIVIKEL